MNQKENVQSSQAQEAGRYFRNMAQFVAFGVEEAIAIRETRIVIEKHIPAIVANLYAHLQEYPPTRNYFLKKDGQIDPELEEQASGAWKRRMESKWWEGTLTKISMA